MARVRTVPPCAAKSKTNREPQDFVDGVIYLRTEPGQKGQRRILSRIPAWSIADHILGVEHISMHRLEISQ